MGTSLADAIMALGPAPLPVELQPSGHEIVELCPSSTPTLVPVHELSSWFEFKDLAGQQDTLPLVTLAKTMHNSSQNFGIVLT